MRKLAALFPIALVGLTGCPASAPSPFMPVASVQEVMHAVVDPAADVLWGSVGWIITEEGTEEIYPRTDEEWEAVEHAAITVMEVGNLLMIPERAIDQEGWIELSQALVTVGKKAVETVLTQDVQATFDVGGEVYVACLNCHQLYWPDEPGADARDTE